MPPPLYTRDILRLASSLEPDDRLSQPDGSARVRSPVCGSEIDIEISTDSSGRIAQLAVNARACAFGQASAAILKRHAKGLSREIAEKQRKALTEFLTGEGDLPDAWPELLHLAPAKDHPGRHAAILLPHDAIIAAFDMAEKSRAA